MSREGKVKRNIEVYADSDDDSMRSLADKLGLPFVSAQSSDVPYRLLKKQEKLYLTGQIELGATAISVDFSSGETNYRREQGGGKRQPIARAIGLNKSAKTQKGKRPLKVLDATAGLGGDAFVLACLGCEVKMLERSPIIAALLEDGLVRGCDDERITAILARMSLINVESELYFSKSNDIPDVIYLDPMYPSRKKSAKVKKEMQILQGLLTHADNDGLLTSALKLAKGRVVVKRPKGADFLNQSAPSHSIESKKTRYDVYLCEI